ncbi:MAG TPA: glycosyltransferase family 39 protein [Pyrinomonadaceae bacterium]|nr:glycosyltransferase family 39 protein [Pyrinomonadaceae bacterium]
MNHFLIVVTALATAGTIALIALMPIEGGPALMFVLPIAAAFGFAVARIKEDEKFLLRLFISAIMVRIFLGSVIYYFHQQEFFGGDANTYDIFGNALMRVWNGDQSYRYMVDLFSRDGAGSGWGMLYVVAAIYKVIGRNMLATQYVNSVLGAVTAPIAYLMAMEIFPNKKVARAAALLTAFYPSLVLWQCQGMKDGPIIFILTLCMLATLKLGNKFSTKYVIILAIGLFALMTLRFYVFYIMVFAVVCALILGRQKLSAQAFLRQFVIMFVVGGVLAGLGVSQFASKQIEQYGSFRQLQVMRLDASRSAASGFGEDIDVSTPEGALAAIPIGLIYLFLAPFPWQYSSVRSMITLPEMTIWWGSIPFLVLGLWFTIKHRLREVAPIVIFLTVLTISYSIVQGNVGNIYRQRAQLLIFYFLFVAVGFALVKEKRDQRAQKGKAEKEANRIPPDLRAKKPAPEGRLPVPG